MRITARYNDTDYALVRGADGQHCLRVETLRLDSVSDLPLGPADLAFVSEIGANFSERDHRRVMALAQVASRLIRERYGIRA